MTNPLNSLRAQLLFSHVLLVILMAGVTGSAIYTLRGIERTYSRERIGNSHASRGGQIVGDALMEQRTALWLLVAGAPNESHQTYTASWKSFDTGLALTKSTDADPTVASAAKQLATDAQAYRRLANEVVTDNSPVLRPDVQKAVKDILEPKIAHLMSDATQLGDFARAASSDDNEAAKEASDSAIARAGWVIFGGLFVALGLGIRLVRAVISPLGALVARAEQIAEGDLSPHPKSARRDEIGALSNAIETMTERIREVRAIARKRLRRAEQMSDAALEHLYDPVIVLDQKSRIVHLNQAAEDLLGKIPDDQKVSVTDHIQDRRLAKALSMASASNKFCISEDEVESFILNSDGVRKIYRFRATPMKDEDGVPIGSVAMLEDITHFREVDRLKNEFIGVASHELRTPVSSLLLSAQLLKDGAVGNLTAAQSEVVDMQLQDLDRLEKLMKDLLDVTKLAAGMTPLKLEQVRVSDLCDQVASTMCSQGAKRGVGVSSCRQPGLGELKVDRGQIGRVLTNLVANAIRHTKSGGQVKIGASAHENDVTFHVEDTGEGIPKDYLARIFDRFVQVPGATQGGAGLGLSIAQNIVKAHHGLMRVESEVGKGSVFSFTLPRDPSDSGKEITA